MAQPLYTPAMLALAVSLADYPLDRDFMGLGEARSRTCGSEVTLGCDVDNDGRITGIGLRVKACAIGQAAAAIFARSACGIGVEELNMMADELAGWLRRDRSMPTWTDLDMLEPALAHPGRHEAILLPWRAAQAALSNGGTAR